MAWHFLWLGQWLIVSLKRSHFHNITQAISISLVKLFVVENWKILHLMPTYQGTIARSSRWFLLLCNSWSMRAVKAGEFPPSLSVTSQPNRLRQWTTTPFHNIVRPYLCWTSARSVAFNHPQHYCLYQSIVIYSADMAEEFVSFVLLGPPPCRVVVLCHAWSCCWLCPSYKLSRFFCNIASRKPGAFYSICCFYGPCFCSIKQTGKYTWNQHINLHTQLATTPCSL